MHTGCKIYAGNLGLKLEKEIKEKKDLLDRTQMEFKESKRTAEAIYILKEAIMSGIKKEKRKIIMGFADMNGLWQN